MNPPTNSLTFHVSGPPRGHARPRFARGHAYTAPADVAYAEAIRAAWVEAGSPHLPDGPWTVSVVAVFTRPKGHWRKDGSLSPAGWASEWPRRKPDGDNILKGILDALVGTAWPDDALCYYMSAAKRWQSSLHLHEGITVTARTEGERG